VKILILGDLHAEFGELNRIINKHQPDAVFCCGDFGYWPPDVNGAEDYKEYFNFSLDKIKNHNTKVFWIPGNHEHWDHLQDHYYRNAIAPAEMAPWSNIYFCPIGSVVNLKGINFLCVGGANSQDKEWRTPGMTWFPQENLDLGDYEFIEKNIKGIKIDCVISHTCPRDFALKTDYPEKFSDPNRHVLNKILHLFNPDKWFFGHWHNYERGQFQDTKWCMLDHSKGHTRWWIDYNDV